MGAKLAKSIKVSKGVDDAVTEWLAHVKQLGADIQVSELYAAAALHLMEQDERVRFDAVKRYRNMGLDVIGKAGLRKLSRSHP